MLSVAVVHLVWIPYGIGIFKDFIRSYKDHSPGYEHDLVILFNGVRQQEKDTREYHLFLKEMGISYTCHYFHSGQDIKAYHWIASQLAHDYLLFLNSFIRILANDWLLHFTRAIQQEKEGAVAATGSWQCYYAAVFVNNSLYWNRDKSFGENFRKYKLFIKAFFYWRLLFKPFPNPHIRTSSFMISRKLFLSHYKKEINNKFDAYLFESGRNGLSSRLLEEGYHLLIVDKNGTVFKHNDWDRSNICFMNGQENLLMSDNRTREYDAAGKEEKRKLTYLAWGKYE